MSILEDFKKRGLIYQLSNDKAVEKLLTSKGEKFYVGFDPTAESLHVGNLLQIITMKRLEKTGLKPIVLAGGATGLIGDPSGRSQERILNSKETVEKWTMGIKKQLGKFFSKNTLFVNNYDWFKKMPVVNFLRDVGKNFPVNSMLAKESVKTRLETGISFTELSYMVLQAYDYLKLYEKYNCRLQLGGSDQWGNITAGIDLIRRTKAREAYGITIPLVTTSDGKKMGKSETGAVWLDGKMTSPYHFYQFWINTDDKDIAQFLKYYSFLSLEKIKKLEESLEKNPEKREMQKALAEEMTEFVHGKEAVKRAKLISERLFNGKVSELTKKDIEEIFLGAQIKSVKFKELNLVDLLDLTKVSGSKRQAREDIQNGAIEINGTKIKDINYIVTGKNLLFGEYLIIKRGKKDYNFTQVK